MIKLSDDIINDLPKDRLYSEAEALVQIAFDFQKKNDWTYLGYSKQFTWSRNKVKRFIEERTLKGHLKRHQIINDSKALQSQKDTPGDTKRTHQMQIYVAKNYKHITRLEQQLTREECNKLLAKYQREQILEMFDQMENYKGVETKYTSVYKTALSWFRIREKKSGATVDSIASQADELLKYCKKFNVNDHPGLIAMIKSSKKPQNIKDYALNKLGG